MTTSPHNASAPDTPSPPANTPPPRGGWRHAPGWLSGWALGLIVACVILRTGIATRNGTTPEESTAFEKNFEAARITKIAYAMSRLPDLNRTSAKAKRASTSPTQFADDAIKSWVGITRSPFAHTSDWRRYALTLSLFHREGIPEALNHIAAARASDKARMDKDKSRSARSRKAQAAEVPVVEEVALWKALYGTTPIPAENVDALRTVIGKLNLGWFEHAALAQLYTRIGQKPQAAQEMEAAYRSASLLLGFQSFDVVLLTLGSLGLLVCGLMFFLNRMAPQRGEGASAGIPAETVSLWERLGVPGLAPGASARATSLPTTAYDNSYSPLVPLAAPPPLPSLPLTVPLPLQFSYRARTIAFSAYMAVFMVIGLPLRLLKPYVEDWSSSALTRLTTLFEIGAYVPVVLIALWVLRCIAASESDSGQRPTWSETFRALGMTSRRPLEDIGVGTINYLMLMPVFIAVTAISGKIFEHYHTPINPVQFDSMMAQNNLDRLLLLIITAVGAPIVEELMFRGVLYPALKPAWGKVGGALFSGAIFAIVHPTIPSGFLPIMLLGVVFALTYERRGSLLPNIVMHGIHNGLILLTVFFLFSR